MEFSAQGSLYILFKNCNDEEFYFRFKVKEQSHGRQKYDKLDLKSRVTLTGFENIDQEIYRQDTNTERSVKYMNVVEQYTGSETLVTIMALRGENLSMMTSSNRDDHVVESYPHAVKSIMRINQSSFALHEKNANNIRLLTVGYDGNTHY